MKAINPLYKILAVATLLVLASCQIDEEFERYNPDTSTIGPGSITYTDLSVYPVPGVVTTAEPVLDISTTYGLVLGEIAAPEGSTFNPNNFSIDKVTGVITYDNENADLSEGAYLINVGITTVNGVVVVDEAVTITVLSVPVSLSVDNAEVSAGALDVGVIATVSYNDLSGENLVTTVAYSLVSPPAGFTIDATTGEITKSVDALEGPNVLTVQAETNLGTVTAENLVTVTVGPPPVIEYFQQDGTTPLTTVTVSPWTAYSSLNPTLTGMDAANGYVVNLPVELDGYAGSFSVDANGSVSLAAEAELPIGSYSIGVTATNSSSISKEFPDVFSLIVEKRWDESNLVVNEDFQDAAGVQEFGSGIMSYSLADAVDLAKFIPALQQSDNAAKDKYWDIRVAKLVGSKNTPAQLIDAVLVLPIDLTQIQGVKDIRVSFGNIIGFNTEAIDNYQRTLAYTYTALNDGSQIPGDWNLIMANDDPDWNGEIEANKPGVYFDDFINSYPTGHAESLTYLTQTSSYHQLGGVDNTKTIYLCWRVTGTPSDNKNSIFEFDDIKVQSSSPFAAVEE